MFVFAAISLYLVIKYYHKQTILSVTTSRSKVDFNRIYFSFVVWAIISIGTVLYTYQLTDTTLTLQFQPEKFAILFLIAIFMIPIQTSTEEYLFRGYLMQGFAGLAKNKWFPLVMTSLIFGLLHAANPEVEKMGYFVLVYYIGTGLFLGIITLMDDGIELALGFHAANNLIGALLVTSEHSVFQTYAIFKDNSVPIADFQSVILPVFIIFPILIFVFSKKYKWTNWKEKLTGKIVNN
jgi:membrane protease YdiL (CAAX protease family)